MFIATAAYNSPQMEAIQILNNWWMDQQNVVCPYQGILFGKKKKKSKALLHATIQMNLKNIMLSE